MKHHNFRAPLSLACLLKPDLSSGGELFTGFIVYEWSGNPFTINKCLSFSLMGCYEKTNKRNERDVAHP